MFLFPRNESTLKENAHESSNVYFKLQKKKIVSSDPLVLKICQIYFFSFFKKKIKKFYHFMNKDHIYTFRLKGNN